MRILKKIIILYFLFFSGCAAPKQENKKIIDETNLETQMRAAYNKGMKALDEGDPIYATKNFNEAELIFPQSEWAPRASLMAAYTHWKFGYYKNSSDELKRFIKLYNNDNNIDYAYYLLAMNYYDSIVNEKKDLKPLQEAKKYFEIILKEYPKTDYALDAKYKLELIKDVTAAKEIYIARHYVKKEKWIAAINRLKIILTEYEDTVYVEEALHRLVEIYYIIGFEEEAKKYAHTLGYNYQSGEWYKETYKLFNTDYEIKKKFEKKSKKNKLVDKIKSFF